MELKNMFKIVIFLYTWIVADTFREIVQFYKMLNTPKLISPNCTKLIEDSNAEEQERKPAIACDFLLLFTVHAVHCFAD